ncbi:MAG: hypothetical protein HQL82_10725 [Magnetococcales bacterium]|nr:hypothetical protein [Magnetococcales bacterium]
MVDHAQSDNPMDLLDSLVHKLERIPVLCSAGFAAVANQMAGFSGGFGASASRATLIQERIESSGTMGLDSLTQDMVRVNEELGGVFKSLERLIGQKAPLAKRLENTIEWGLTLEQKAFLPRVVDQFKSTGSERMERNAQGSMIDNLLEQAGPLINEIVAATQETRDMLDQMARRLIADLDSSRHGAKLLDQHTGTALGRMAREVGKISSTCKHMEERSATVGGVVFEMVQAMQFDDITAQRIQHVVEALHKARTRIGNDTQADGTPEAIRWFVIALRISIGQLRETTADLIKAVADMQELMSRIAGLAEDQVGDISAARTSARHYHQDAVDLTYLLGSMLRLGVFEEGLSSDVLRNLSRAENGIFQARRALQMLMMTATRLDNLAGALKTEGNRRLTALTESIRELAGLIGLDGNEMGDEFDKTAAKLQRIGATFSENTTPRLMRASGLLRRIPLATQQLDTSNNDLIRLMNESIADTHATSANILLLNAEMDFAAQIRELSEDLILGMDKLLAQVAGDCTDYLEGDLSSMAGEFEDLAKLYTMKSERLIHSAELDGSGSAEEGGEDDIELF